MSSEKAEDMNLLLDGLSRRWSILWETLDKKETTFVQGVSQLSLNHGKHWLRKEADDRLCLDAVVLFEEDRCDL
jgi:hypothetical protein